MLDRSIPMANAIVAHTMPWEANGREQSQHAGLATRSSYVRSYLLPRHEVVLDLLPRIRGHSTVVRLRLEPVSLEQIDELVRLALEGDVQDRWAGVEWQASVLR